MLKTDLRPIVYTTALLFGLVIHGSANSVTITSGLFSAQSGTTATFDSGYWPAGFSATGSAGIVSGSVPDVYLSPSGDTTPYAYVDPGGSVTDTLGGGAVYFGIDWGSPDFYNTLTLVDSNGVVTVYGGGSTPVPGLTLDQTTGQYVNFFDSGAPWETATFTSEGVALEFDNVTTATTTPESASILLLPSGLIAIAIGAFRRRQISA